MPIGTARLVFACVTAALCACTCHGSAGADGPPSAPQTPSRTPEPEPEKVQRTEELMGTVIAMTTLGVPKPRAETALAAAFGELRRLTALLSEWEPDSEVSRVNDGAGKAPVRVSADTLTVVKVGQDVARWSDGAFDLSWAALRGLYLFRPGEERVPTDAELARLLPLVSFEDIVVDEAASTVFLRKRGMKLGTGGVAKGYALEKAAQQLRQHGVDNYMIFGGGQVLVHGTKAGRPWRVGIQHPRMDDYFAFVEATSGSIATSGDYEHAFVKDGKRWHHIIDLETGRPVTHTTSVTVVSESAFYADAIDTALFILGPEQALARLSSAPGPKADVLIVDEHMKLFMTDGMRTRLQLRMPTRDGRLPPGAPH